MLKESDMLNNTAKVICQLFINGEIKFSDALKELIKIQDRLDEIASEEAYRNSLKDYLDTPEAFLYKGKV